MQSSGRGWDFSGLPPGCIEGQPHARSCGGRDKYCSREAHSSPGKADGPANCVTDLQNPVGQALGESSLPAPLKQRLFFCAVWNAGVGDDSARLLNMYIVPESKTL